MSLPPSSCVLVVADPERIAELAAALAEPLPQGAIEVVVSTGGDDTIDLFGARLPAVVVVTASLDTGDTRALIETLRGMVPRAEVNIVLVGDRAGPVRTALDAIELAPDRFIGWPVAPKALRFAVGACLDTIALVRGPMPAAPEIASAGDQASAAPAAVVDDDPTQAQRLAQRARWASLADSIVLAPDGSGLAGDDDEVAAGEVADEAAPLPPPLTIHPRARGRAVDDGIAPVHAWQPGTTAELVPWPPDGANASDSSPPPLNPAAAAATTLVVGSAAGDRRPEAPLREPTLILRDPHDEPLVATTFAGMSADEARRPAGTPSSPSSAPSSASASSAGAADSSAVPDRVASSDGIGIPRTATIEGVGIPRTATIDGIGVGVVASSLAPDAPAPAPAPVGGPVSARDSSDDAIVISRTMSGVAAIDVAERGHDDQEIWSEPMPIRELVDRDSRPTLDKTAPAEPPPRPRDDLGMPLDDFDDELVLDDDDASFSASRAADGRRGVVDDLRGDGALHAELDDLADDDDDADASADVDPFAPTADDAYAHSLADDQLDDDRPSGGRDFARQLRAKMSMMAQRLFQGTGADNAASGAVELGPRHDHHTEIDLAALGEEQPLGGGNTEIEARAAARLPEQRDLVTSPGSWDTQVRERGLPDAGELVRGLSDAAALLAKMFHGEITGRVRFRRDDVDTLVYFDLGRPVFASSSEPRDRMGELLVREGKITLAQYGRCQAMVAESGRRMGEILVDLGYLKRRELLPAVRRHVEDLVYALFGWDRGQYHIHLDAEPSAERIRLSRHPASLILEGIRRKLDRATLERLVGPSSTVIEVPDRERVGGVLNLGDLAGEERAALAAFDGQADLAAVARTAGIDIADLLPLAWGLCVLGLATARRAEAEVPDESNALVGETDLAIDRERVRARWRLVTDADYFALLGVRREATGFEIRRAYQASRRDFAADCFPGDLRRELARELDDIANVLDEAFRVLRDDRLRLTYLSNLVDET